MTGAAPRAPDRHARLHRLHRMQAQQALAKRPAASLARPQRRQAIRHARPAPGGRTPAAR